MLIYATKSLIYYGFTTGDYVVLFIVWSSFYHRLWYEMQNKNPQIFFTQNVQLQYIVVRRMNARLAASFISITYTLYFQCSYSSYLPQLQSSYPVFFYLKFGNSRFYMPAHITIVIQCHYYCISKVVQFFIKLDVEDYNYDLLLGYHKQ